MSNDELKKIIDPKNYLGLSSKFAQQKSVYAKKIIQKLKKKRFILLG